MQNDIVHLNTVARNMGQKLGVMRSQEIQD